MLWEVLTLKTPWSGMGANEIWLRVQSGERPTVTAADDAAAPNGYIALMRELWEQDPVARPTFAEALRRLRAMLDERPDSPSGAVELDLVSDLFEEEGLQEDWQEEAYAAREENTDNRVEQVELQHFGSPMPAVGSTPTAGDYARARGYSSIVDMMMADSGWASGGWDTCEDPSAADEPSIPG